MLRQAQQPQAQPPQAQAPKNSMEGKVLWWFRQAQRPRFTHRILRWLGLWLLSLSKHRNHHRTFPYSGHFDKLSVRYATRAPPKLSVCCPKIINGEYLISKVVVKNTGVVKIDFRGGLATSGFSFNAPAVGKSL